jgi:hypothetical protein
MPARGIDPSHVATALPAIEGAHATAYGHRPVPVLEMSSAAAHGDLFVNSLRGALTLVLFAALLLLGARRQGKLVSTGSPFLDRLRRSDMRRARASRNRGTNAFRAPGRPDHVSLTDLIARP